MNSAAKLEIFLCLAQKRAARKTLAQNGGADLLPEIESPANELPESELKEPRAEENLAAVFEQLGETEIGKLRRLLGDFARKPEAEKQKWLSKIESGIGADENFVDKNVHRSHIEAALQRETLAVRKIIEQFPNDLKNGEPAAENKRFSVVKQTARKAFARQFVSLRDIKKPMAFDRLDGGELARLVRWAGIKEIAFACAQIEAVETVAAFLRRFSAEDARQIAAQLRSLPKVSAERLDFAENLVQTAFAEEENSSAMLDWLGIRLVGILLCNAPPERVAYARQKFPFEFGTQLAEIIEAPCTETPAPLQTGIRAEIEQLAETVLETRTRAR